MTLCACATNANCAFAQAALPAHAGGQSMSVLTLNTRESRLKHYAVFGTKEELLRTNDMEEVGRACYSG